MQLIAELYSEEIINELGENFFPQELSVVKKVRGIIKKEDGLTALIYYGKYNAHTLPGGSVEKGEDPETAIVREVKEETGYDSKITDVIGCILEYSKRSNGKNSLTITYCYKLEAFGEPEPLILSEKEKDLRFGLRWLSETEVLNALHQDSIEAEKKGVNRSRDYLFMSYAN